jgi:hypothetical protein
MDYLSQETQESVLKEIWRKEDLEEIVECKKFFSYLKRRLASRLVEGEMDLVITLRAICELLTIHIKNLETKYEREYENANKPNNRLFE